MTAIKVIPYNYKEFSYPRVIVKPIDREQSITEGGLLIPTDVNKICERGIVFAADEDSFIKKGDTLLYKKIDRSSEEILDTVSYEDEVYDVIFENEIWAVNDFPFNKIFVVPVSDLQVGESGLLLPDAVKGITEKGIIFRAPHDNKYFKSGYQIEYRKQEQGIYPNIEIENKRYEVLTEQDVFMVNGKVSPYRIIVRIDKVAQEAKRTKADSGLLRSQLYLFMLYNLQYGEVIEIGKEARSRYPDMKIGDTAILHHAVEDKGENYRIIKKEISKYGTCIYEHRVINAWETSNREIMGRIANRKDMIIIPYGKSVFLDYNFSLLEKTEVQLELLNDFDTNLDKCHTLPELAGSVKQQRDSLSTKAYAKLKGYHKLLSEIKNPAAEKERFQRYESQLATAKVEAEKVAAQVNKNHLVVCKKYGTNEKIITTYKELYPLDILGKKFLIAYSTLIFAKLNNDMKITPLENRIIVKPIEDNTFKELLMPAGAKEKPQKGTVMAVGEGKEGKPMKAKEGDTVFYRKGAGVPFPAEYCGGEEGCVLMKEGDDAWVVISQD
jgi:chaperonin GroES